MSKSKEKVLTTTALLTALAFWSTSIASAQVSEPSTGEDEAAVQDTVVVTARRRSENVQEIPGAITVITESTIETARVEQIADVIALTPGANLRENFSPAFTNLTVRGIPTQQNGELPIALSVDGVTVPFTSFLNQDLLDVDQIEVLRGPQGGLYGRNAIAGAINISTRRPSDEVEGRVRLSYGNGDYLQAFGTVSGPLADGVYGKLGVSYKNFDGLIESGQVDETLDFNEEFSTFGRLIFEPTDNLSLDFRGRYTTSNVGASYFEVVPLTDIDNFDTDPLVNAPANNDRELYESTSKIDYETDAGTFTSITGYFDVEDSLRGESDFGVFAPPEQLQEFDTTVDGWSQEFRFASPDDQPFRWLLGAFYQDRTVTTFTNILVDPGDADPFPVFLVEDSTNDSESYAIFGQGTYDLTDRLELSVALRYDEDQRSTVDLAQSTESLSRTFSQFQPKVSLSYDVSDEVLLYATWGKGFRSGGFNGFAAPVEARTFDAEVSTNYEVGFKSTLADGRLIANGSLYFIDYEDQQFFAFFDAFTSAIVNADATDIYGVEFELDQVGPIAHRGGEPPRHRAVASRDQHGDSGEGHPGQPPLGNDDLDPVPPVRHRMRQVHVVGHEGGAPGGPLFGHRPVVAPRDRRQRPCDRRPHSGFRTGIRIGPRPQDRRSRRKERKDLGARDLGSREDGPRDRCVRSGPERVQEKSEFRRESALYRRGPRLDGAVGIGEDEVHRCDDEQRIGDAPGLGVRSK